MVKKRLKTYAMIPARIGSQRLKMKNIALLNNRPLISYSIDNSKNSSVFDKIVLNSDHDIFQDIANRHKVDFYKRPRKIGKSKVNSDDVVFDFFESHPSADILAWINPVSPLQDKNEIRKIVKYFKKNNLDSLITSENKYVHCMFNEDCVNFDKLKKFDRTQDLQPISIFVYSVMMWRRSAFISEYKKNNYAFFCGKFSTYTVSRQSGLFVKNKDDLDFIDLILKSQKNKHQSKTVRYDKVLEKYEDLKLKK